MKIYSVGGAVRDKLLNYPVHEYDWVVVGATPQEMLAKGFSQVGKDFPVFLHPTTKEEYALARTERKTAPGYAGFAFDTSPKVTLEDDLIRRDLTINAIAMDDTGNIIDPYGGQKDLQAKQLRHVSNAFGEDPVRILRVARFAARYHHLGFRVADETRALMRDMVASGEVDSLVAERVWKELSRALLEKSPQVFIEVLRDCGALARIMPELDALFGVPQPPEHHPEIDTGVHVLMVLNRASELSDILAVRFAALMHDLGKGLTPSEEWPSHHGHEKLGIKALKNLCARLAVPNGCKALAMAVCEYHTHAHRAFELKPATIDKLFNALKAYKNVNFFEQFLVACQADSQGRTGFESRPYPQAEFLSGARKATEDINAEPFTAEGLTGAAIGEAITHARVKAISEFKSTYEQVAK